MAGRLESSDFLRDLAHEVARSIKRNLKVDWNEPHREDIRATVRSAVKRTLRQRGVEAADLEAFTAAAMAHGRHPPRQLAVGDVKLDGEGPIPCCAKPRAA